MSLDSAYDQQERYLAYGTGIYLILIFWVIFIQITWPAYTKNTEGIITNILSKVLPMDFLSLAYLTAIAFAIGYFLKYLGIHDIFDNLSHIRFKKQITDKICERIVEHNNKAFPDSKICRKPNQEGMIKDDKELLYIFYEFINRQDNSWAVQRALFFSYILKYRLSMNLIVFSIIGIAANFVVLLIMNRLNYFGYYSLMPYLFFTIVGLASFVISQKKIRKEIIDWVTTPQLDRITYDEKENLNDLLKKRFHSGS